jgi:hypothetical protein
LSRVETIAQGVTLYLGDCRDILPVLPKTGAVLVSDVPYGVAFKCGWSNQFKDVRIANDETTAARDAILALWGDAPAIIFGSWKVERPAGTRLLLTWDKGTVGMGDLSLPWFPCTEEIYVLGDGFAGSRTSAVMRHVSRNEHHPTEKPVSLMGELIEKCRDGLAIIDPFMGSGSTGVAAVKLGRTFTGIEIEPKYFDIACRRIEAAAKQPDLFIAAPKAATQVTFAEIWREPYYNEDGTPKVGA